ncbi:MAG: hypothetical protein ACI9WU_001065, partial [Myxococcota bacterium]
WGEPTCGSFVVRSSADCPVSVLEISAAPELLVSTGSWDEALGGILVSVTAYAGASLISDIQVTAAGQPLSVQVALPVGKGTALRIEGHPSFTTTLFGEVSSKITLCNEGLQSFLSQDLYFEGDPDNTFWRVEPDLPAFAIGSQECLDLRVHYIGTETGRNAALIVTGQAASARLPVWGGPPTPWFVWSPSDAAQGTLSLVNRGNAPGDPVVAGSDGGSLSSEPPGTLPGISIFPVSVAVGGAGTLSVDGGPPVTVSGAPASAPQLTLRCGAARVGRRVVVESDTPSLTGWHLRSKPTASTVLALGPHQGAQMSWVPDKPGVWEVGLAGATLTLEVAASDQ